MQTSRWFIVATGAVMSAALIAGQVVNLWFAGALRDLPSTEHVTLDLTQSIRILDREGGELYRVTQDEDRTSLALEEIPANFLHAIVDIEDERFFERGGCIDIQGIARAAWRNFVSGEASEGASTITQQLVRSLYLQPDKTLARKVREIAIACRLEGALSKEEILTLYVNRVAFGNRAYGLEQAAQTYFNTRAADLTLAQAAVLAALPQRPSYFDPYGPHLRTAIEPETQDALQAGTLKAEDVPRSELATGLLPRRVKAGSGEMVLDGRAALVLKAMRRNGHLTDEQEAAARGQLETMAFAPPKRIALEAPHFVFWVREQLDALMAEDGRGREWAA
ncbi:MAG: transglycosylase domain-containing protein, partial [Candidatus Peribacteraceae bacterium]|nr:transglycosylase domain-containing protein [Candidatus Peribacteraceae bacterium]